uniref:Uncharacterized protein n=1 Tax=Tanacetum cinerariifolium TaxID=118510 RepID=A0A6L2JFW0_TANCI|nr:hypothetical protein [Tanacetum cinerariifolium]
MDPDEFEAPQSSEQTPPSPDYVPGEEESSKDDDDKEEEDAFEEDEEEKARKTVRPQPPMTASTKALITKYAFAPTLPSPPPSPLSPLTSPLHMIPSPPLLLPPLHTSPTYASVPLGYKAVLVQLRAASPLPVPSPLLHVPSPPLLLPSADRRRHTLACRVDYEFIDTLDASIRAPKSRVITVVEEVNKRVADLATIQRQDAHELYVRDEDAQDDRDLFRAQISLLKRDRAQEACITTLETQTRALHRDVTRTRDAEHQDRPADAGSSSALAVLITRASQSRHHGKSESDSYYLSD